MSALASSGSRGSRSTPADANAASAPGPSAAFSHAPAVARHAVIASSIRPAVSSNSARCAWARASPGASPASPAAASARSAVESASSGLRSRLRRSTLARNCWTASEGSGAGGSVGGAVAWSATARGVRDRTGARASATKARGTNQRHFMGVMLGESRSGGGRKTTPVHTSAPASKHPVREVYVVLPVHEVQVVRALANVVVRPVAVDGGSHPWHGRRAQCPASEKLVDGRRVDD